MSYGMMLLAELEKTGTVKIDDGVQQVFPVQTWRYSRFNEPVRLPIRLPQRGST